MPRPGTRPFECIRRAWHSDSHQPLRGTLIQEIFRLVNELHSTSTRRKKEWQEKLPIVVLRAEEILYSKANSEGEYADVATLRSRLEDAVNTMIRREDGEEEGVYLVPCVEAALSLGCTPKKGTRGLRQGSSRHLSSAARRVGLTVGPAAIEKSNAVTMSMDSMPTSHNKHSSSTFGSMSTQALPMQEREIHVVAHPSNPLLFTSAGAFWDPAHTNASFIPLQNRQFHQSPEVFHPAGISSFASSFPKPGALVQFLRADACISSGLPCPDVLYALPQARLSINQGLRPLQLLDSAESSGARIGSRLPCATGSMVAHSYPPPCSISRLLLDLNGDSSVAANQYKPDLGAVIASSLDSASCILVQNARPSSADMESGFQPKESPSLPGGGHGSTMALVPGFCNSYKTAISQQNFSRALSRVDDKSGSPSGEHDLQLRLGLPINELIASSDDASTPKRTRIDETDA